MGRKCSTYGCTTNYKTSTDKIPVYRFPTDPDKLAAWVTAMPDAISVNDVTKWMGLCAIHFPDAHFKKVPGGYLVPDDPPTYFPHAPKSSWGPPPSKQRKTTMSTAEARIGDPEQDLKEFLSNDALILKTFRKCLEDHVKEYDGHIVWHLDNESISFISNSRKGPIFNYSLHFRITGIISTKSLTKFKGLEYEAYHELKRKKHPAFPSEVKCWTGVKELLKYVCKPPAPSDDEKDSKMDFIRRQIHLVNLPKNSHIYDPEDIFQAFSMYSISRHLYGKLRDLLQLPSISTLQKITSAASNIDDDTFFASFFSNQSEKEKCVTGIVDEIYVKSQFSLAGKI